MLENGIPQDKEKKVNDPASNAWAQFYYVLHIEAERLRELMAQKTAAARPPLECPEHRETPPTHRGPADQKHRKRWVKVCNE